MLDMPRSVSTLVQLSRGLALIAALGLGASLPGCADIHPESNDPDVGIMDAPDDEAVHERESAEESAEHGDEEQQQRK